MRARAFDDIAHMLLRGYAGRAAMRGGNLDLDLHRLGHRIEDVAQRQGRPFRALRDCAHRRCSLPICACRTHRRSGRCRNSADRAPARVSRLPPLRTKWSVSTPMPKSDSAELIDQPYRAFERGIASGHRAELGRKRQPLALGQVAELAELVDDQSVVADEQVRRCPLGAEFAPHRQRWHIDFEVHLFGQRKEFDAIDRNPGLGQRRQRLRLVLQVLPAGGRTGRCWSAAPGRRHRR